MTFDIYLWPTANADGSHTLKLRLTQYGIPKYEALEPQVCIRKNQWDKKAHRVKTNHPNYATINTLLSRVENLTEKCILDIALEDKYPTYREIFETVFNRKHSRDFFDLANEILSKIKGFTKDTYSDHLQLIRQFHGAGPLTLNQVNVDFLRKFKAWQGDVKPNTIANRMGFISMVLGKAIEMEILKPDQNPFKVLKFRRKKTDKNRHDITDLQKIIALKLNPKFMPWHARNFYLFSIYSLGMRFTDVCLLKRENLAGNILTYRTHKSGYKKQMVTELPPEAMQIVKLYERDSILIFPLLSDIQLNLPEDVLISKLKSRNRRVGEAMKKIDTLAGINKGVTFHGSRNVAAAEARAAGASTHHIQGVLMHDSITTTEIYMGELGSKEAATAVNNLLSGFYKEMNKSK